MKLIGMLPAEKEKCKASVLSLEGRGEWACSCSIEIGEVRMEEVMGQLGQTTL